MKLLRHEYLEYHDQAANRHKFYLLTVTENQGSYRTLALWGRVGGQGRFSEKYPDACGATRTDYLAATTEAFVLGQEKCAAGYVPKSLPSHVARRLANLEAYDAAAPRQPVASATAGSMGGTGAAARAELQGFLKLLRPASRTGGRAPASIGQALAEGWRAQVLLPTRGRAGLITAPEHLMGNPFFGPATTDAYLAGIQTVLGDGADSPVPDTIVEIIDNGAMTLVHDIARFDGHDVRAENLLTRLALVEVVRDELQSVDCWPARWLTVPAEPAVTPRTAHHSPIVVKRIEAPYASVTTWDVLF